MRGKRLPEGGGARQRNLASRLRFWAVETPSYIESRLAINASPNHNAASAQTPVICKSAARQCSRLRRAREPHSSEAVLESLIREPFLRIGSPEPTTMRRDRLSSF